MQGDARVPSTHVPAAKAARPRFERTCLCSDPIAMQIKTNFESWHGCKRTSFVFSSDLYAGTSEKIQIQIPDLVKVPDKRTIAGVSTGSSEKVAEAVSSAEST